MSKCKEKKKPVEIWITIDDMDYAIKHNSKEDLLEFLSDIYQDDPDLSEDFYLVFKAICIPYKVKTETTICIKEDK